MPPNRQQNTETPGVHPLLTRRRGKRPASVRDVLVPAFSALTSTGEPPAYTPAPETIYLHTEADRLWEEPPDSDALFHAPAAGQTLLVDLSGELLDRWERDRYQWARRARRQLSAGARALKVTVVGVENAVAAQNRSRRTFQAAAGWDLVHVRVLSWSSNVAVHADNLALLPITEPVRVCRCCEFSVFE
jgi:hypothetical protein